MKPIFRDGMLLTFFVLAMVTLVKAFPDTMNDKGASWIVIICAACMALVAINFFDKD